MAMMRFASAAGADSVGVLVPLMLGGIGMVQQRKYGLREDAFSVSTYGTIVPSSREISGSCVAGTPVDPASSHRGLQ